MNAVEFQLESPSLVLSRFSPSQRPDQNRFDPALESTLLGLRLRGSLCDYDRSILDLLIDEPNVAFLVQDGRYLHPEDLPLVPAAVLETTLLRNTEAVFRQRLAPTGRAGSSGGLVRAARISRSGEPELVLGAIGPDNPYLRERHDDWFGNLVVSFRQAWNRSGAVAERLRQRVDSMAAWLIIYRTSGRVLAIDPHMSDYLGCPPDQAVGCEYSALWRSRSDVIGCRRLTLENINVEGVMLTLAGLPRTGEPVAPSAGDRLFSDYFVRALRTRLASIASAATQLGRILPWDADSDASELAVKIENEARELNRYLDRLQMSTDTPRPAGAPGIEMTQTSADTTISFLERGK